MYKSWMWKQRSFREQFNDGTTGSTGAAAAPAGGEGGEAGAEQQQSTDETSQGEQQADQQEQQAEEDGEVVVTFGDEPPAATTDDEIEGKPAPAWVKDLRKQARELARENRELKQAQQATQQQTAPKAEDVGPKPTPEDFDFDAEKFGEALLAWNEKKKVADAKADAIRQEQEAAQAEWNKRIAAYNTAKAKLNVSDFEGAEDVVRQAMSPLQVNVMLDGADKPELLVYALGRNPAKVKELAAIKNPVKFAFALAKLETQLKVQPRATQPPPAERAVRSSAGGATAVDNQLARLEAEADRTGDRSKVIAYKREQRNKAA
jgi:hypothetical protein